MDKDQYHQFVRDRVRTLLSQQEKPITVVAQLIGKSNAYFSDIAAGKQLLSFDALFDLCDYFNITPTEFFDEKIDIPGQDKELARECHRLCGDQLNEMIDLLKIMEPSQMDGILKFLRQVGHKDKK